MGNESSYTTHMIDKQISYQGFWSSMMKRSKSKTPCKYWGFLLLVIVLVMQGCATTKPTPVDPLAYKDRTKSSVSGDVTGTVAVPTIAEAQAIYEGVMKGSNL